MDKIALGPGNVTYPTRNFALDVLLPTKVGGPVISAGLCMSPCSSDYIIPDNFGTWRIVSEDPKNG